MSSNRIRLDLLGVPNRIALHFLVIVLLAVCTNVRAELKLASIFGPNMVLQQQMPVRVWGWAAPGEEISVDFAGQHKTAKADAKGAWKLELDAMHASAESRTLKVAAKGEG